MLPNKSVPAHYYYRIKKCVDIIENKNEIIRLLKVVKLTSRF